MRFYEFASSLAESQSDENIERAFEIIEEYVTYGEVHGESAQRHFDARFAELINLLPRPRRNYTLYRAMRLTDEQVAQIKNGLSLTHRPFMSWTKNKDIAERIAWDKGQKGVPVIATVTFPANEIVVDVLEFYRAHGYTQYESYFEYVRKEQEVIVHHTAPIIMTSQNTTFLSRDAICPPQEGDMAFLPDEDDGYEILQVLGGNTKTGVYQVLVSGLGEADVRPIMIGNEQAEGEWEII